MDKRKIKKYFQKELNQITTDLKAFWKLKKIFLIISIILLIAFLAILRANFFYIDDMGRTMEGYRGWGNFSRFTSNGLATFVHTGTYLGDIAPFSQIIAIVLLALACCILLYAFKVKIYKRKITFFDIAAVLILALSPYFLECFSYRFDSPYMALSILASVLPLLFLGGSSLAYYASIFFGTLIMCTTYQAASGIFPVVIILVCIASFIQGRKFKDLFIFGLKSAAAYGLGVLFFRFFIMVPTLEGDYVNNSILPLSNLIPGTIAHLKDFYRLIIHDYRRLWLIFIVIICALLPIMATIKTKNKRIPTLLITLLGMGACFALAFGLYPVLESPLMATRAMYGFGVVLAMLALQVTSLIDRHFILQLPVLALSYCFIVFACIYGNSLYQQQRWADFRAEALIADIQNLPALTDYDTTTLRLQDSIGLAVPVQNYINATGTPVLGRLVPSQLRGGWMWGCYALQYYRLGNIDFIVDEAPADVAGYTKVISNNYHDIYTKDNNIIVIFN